MTESVVCEKSARIDQRFNRYGYELAKLKAVIASALLELAIAVVGFLRYREEPASARPMRF